MGTGPLTAELLGRAPLLNRLTTLTGRAARGDRAVALISGPAGIGKTSLLRAAAADAVGRDLLVAWGTGVAGGAPGYWPCTQALNDLIRQLGVETARRLAGDEAALLATVATSLDAGSRGPVPPWRPPADDGQARLQLLDAVTRWLGAMAETYPLVIIVDDLQWADGSSLELLDYLAGAPARAALALILAYRDDELSGDHRRRVHALATHAEHLPVSGLDAESTTALVKRTAAIEVPPEVRAEIVRRSNGHPLFARELATLWVGSADTSAIPLAVREIIDRRLDRLGRPTVDVLAVAAVGGMDLPIDLVAAAMRLPTEAVEEAIREAVDAGIVAAGSTGTPRFVHDLYRESIEAGLPVSRRQAIHHAWGTVLEERAESHQPSEVARHHVAAMPVDVGRAVQWSLAAAAADADALAFAGAAAQLGRVRSVATELGLTLPADQLIEVLLAEADALARAGCGPDARHLLRIGRDTAVRVGDAERLARLALATSQLGSPFSARRDEVIDDLESALASGELTPATRARLMATLARELQHSVPDDRERAGPLSERALEVGRDSGDATAVLSCLLARHDVLWTPGRADERADLARQITDVAHQVKDVEMRATGLLLLANAELERGSGAYLAALESCLALLDQLGQPRHRYTAVTRRTALALLRDDLDAAARGIDEAEQLGHRIFEPDTDNVAMSQRLELVRSRGIPSELQAFAASALQHWLGAPVHANAVAAGFYARSGDLERAAQHTSTVLDLGGWQADRSYLWSVLVRELSRAAVALEDTELCRRLWADLEPLGAVCGVNGAVVAFAGSSAHTAGLLARAVGEEEVAERLLDQARLTYRRLGARRWLTDLDRDLQAAEPGDGPVGRMRRMGSLWVVTYGGREATLNGIKGLGDLARLVARPGTDIAATELMEAVGTVGSGSSSPVLDQAALKAYRRRLSEIDTEADEADAAHDMAASRRLSRERDALLAELRHVVTPAGRSRVFANYPAERARKAVSGRIRAAIAQLRPVLPELAEHLDRSVVTGTSCRYRPGEVTWHVAWE